MDRVSAPLARRPFGAFPMGKCPHQLSSSLLPCRPLPAMVASRRGIFYCAALSDGGSQGMSAALNPKIMGDAASQLEFSESARSRAAPSPKGERERVNAGDLLQTSSRSSWEEWLKHFDTMDELAEDAAHYQVEMNTAVRQERYSDAARHKRKLQEIQSADTVASVQRQLQEALSAEQYGAAAELRDRGLVGLSGWWAGKDGAEDFQGHLLHVKPEFGRWTGRIYMARDIAAMNGWGENKLAQLMDRASERGAAARGVDSPSSGGGMGLGAGTIGTPMMEVFVRNQTGAQPAIGTGSSGGAAGEQRLVSSMMVHQAVALRPPAPKAGSKKGGGDAGAAAATATKGGAAAGASPQLNPASVVRLSIHVARDGSARISVLPPKPIKSEFSSWEEEEMRATMAALAGDGLKPAAPRSMPRTSSSTAAAVDGFQRPSDGDDDDEDDILTELTRMPAQVAMKGRDRFTFTVLEQNAAASGAGDADGAEPLASGSGIDLSRWAAVPIDEDDISGDEGDIAAVAAAAAAAQRRVSGAAVAADDVAVVEVEVQVVDAEEVRPAAGGRTLLDAADAATAAAAASDAEDDDENDGALSVSMGMLSSGYGTVDAVATSVTDAEEQQILIEIPVGRLLRQQQREAEEQRRASSAGAGTSAAAAPERTSKDTFDRLAERVAQLQAARAGRPVPPEHLATALRTLAHRLVNGELAADGSSSATATVASPAAIAAQKADAAAAARLQAASSTAAATGRNSAAPYSSSATGNATAGGKPPHLGATRISYSRVPSDLPRSDPFCGLYLGAFGPHGPELIQLSRTMQDGEEVVCATKVTGDPNVPAGEVSFRAKVARRHRLDSRNVYPDELGIVARYKGEGRVAMAGYKSPRWVDGELLVFAVGASPVTSGAELGFVWSVPGEKRFLILLNKLDLKECEK